MPPSNDGFLWTPSSSTVGLITEAVVSGTHVSTVKDNYDVVVIGTGFAGLVAARNLARDTSLNVLLVEGRDRIGGRTWTAKALGEEFEMGGTWVHWNQPHVYAELHRYRLHRNLKTSSGTISPEKTFYRPSYGPLQEVDTKEFNAAAQRAADAFFAVDGLTSRELMPYPHEPFHQPFPWLKYDHLSARDRLDQLDVPQFEKDAFDTLVSSFGSVPGSECGFTEVLRWYALGGHSMAGVFELAGTYKLGNGGMTSFANAILSDYNGHLLFNTVIKQIAHDSRGAVLFAENGRQIRCSYVVSTIPLNCLSDVTFSPPLSPLRNEAINAGHINNGAKIHFHLGQTEAGWFAAANGYGDSPWCFAFSDHNGAAGNSPKKKANGTFCIGFGYGSHLTDPKDSGTIISSFKEFQRPGVDIKAYLTHDWANDPLAKGTWSCWGPNCMGKWLKELQKADGRILFASADWAEGWRGFVDGAIERGAAAAIEIKDLFEKDSVRSVL